MKRKIRSLYVLLFLLIVLVIPVDAKEYSNVNLDSSLIDQEIITEPETLMESETIWVDDTEDQTKNTERFTEETEKTESTTETVDTENGISDIEEEYMIANMEQMGISGEISFEVLYDEYNKPRYILSTGESSYAIARREDHRVIERSKSSPSPYNDYIDLKKYYGGALCYYVWMNDKYYDIRTGEYCDQVTYVISPNNSHADEVEWQDNNDNIEQGTKRNTISEKSKKVYPGKAYIAQADQYIRRPAFGNNTDGTCSAVACGIALNYLDQTKLSGIVPAYLSPLQQMESYESSENITGDKLHRFIAFSCYMPPASHGSMLSAGIERYRNKFEITRNARLSLNVVDNIKYDVYYVVVEENITNDMPVIVTTMLGGGDHQLHSMVAYGYSVEPSDMAGSSFFVKLHEGWYGDRYMESYTEGGNELYQTREYELDIFEISYLYEFSLEEPMPKEAPDLNNISENNGTYEMSWNPVKSADSYDIYRSTSQDDNYIKIDNVKGDHKYSYSPGNDTLYYYKIKAVRECYDGYIIESSFSNKISINPKPKLTARITEENDIQLNWTSNPNYNNRFDIYRGEEKHLPGWIGTTKDTTFTDTGIRPGVSYTYYISVNNQFEKNDSNTVSIQVRNIPKILSIKPVSNANGYAIELKWKKFEHRNLRYYTWKVATSINGYYYGIQGFDKTDTSVTIKPLPAEMMLYFKIIAHTYDGKVHEEIASDAFIYQTPNAVLLPPIIIKEQKPNTIISRNENMQVWVYETFKYMGHEDSDIYNIGCSYLENGKYRTYGNVIKDVFAIAVNEKGSSRMSNVLKFN